MNAQDPLESPVSALLAWTVATLTCATRLLADEQSRTAQSADALLLMLGVRNLIRAAEWSADNASETYGQVARRAVIAKFHDRLPNVLHARDVLEHFDEYAVGRGRAQRLAVRDGRAVTAYSFQVLREEADVTLDVGPHRFSVLEMRDACRELVILLLAVQEREENPTVAPVW